MNYLLRTDHSGYSDVPLSLDQISEAIMIGDNLMFINPDGTETLLGIITGNTYAKIATDIAEHNIIHYSKNPDQRTIDGIAAIREYIAGDLPRNGLGTTLRQMQYAVNRFNIMGSIGAVSDSDPDHIVAGTMYSLVFPKHPQYGNNRFLQHLNDDPILRQVEATRQGQYILDYLASTEYIFSLGLK